MESKVGASGKHVLQLTAVLPVCIPFPVPDPPLAYNLAQEIPSGVWASPKLIPILRI